MKVLVQSTRGDVSEILQKLGILAEPSDVPSQYYIELETLEDLFGLSEVLDVNLLAFNFNGKNIVEILNDNGDAQFII